VAGEEDAHIVQRPQADVVDPPAGTRPLITAEELAGYLQRDLDRYSADLAVQGASGLVRTACGWNVSRVVETLTVNGNGSASMNLPTLRLNDVTEVRVDGVVVDASAYGWGANGVLVAVSRWPLGLRRVEVDADHGYEPIPDELRIVCCSVAARLYSNPENLLQRSAGTSSQMFRDLSLSELETRLISPHRLT
jgi:hypothetical protein